MHQMVEVLNHLLRMVVLLATQTNCAKFATEPNVMQHLFHVATTLHVLTALRDVNVALSAEFDFKIS